MMPKTFTPNRAIAFAVFAPIFYFILSFFLAPAILRDIFSSLAFGCAVVITVTWFFAFVEAMKHEGKMQKWKLILAIFVTWFVVLAQRVYVVLFNYMGRPDEWANSAISGYWPYSFFIAGCLFITATTEDEGVVPTFTPVLIAVAIGAGLTGLLIGMGIGSI